MIFVRNRLIPFGDYDAVTVWPLVLYKRLRRFTVNHESIHGRQQLEMLVLPFFLWYGIEWLVRLIVYRNRSEAYCNISFEQEAYLNEADEGYLSRRRHFSWVRYLGRKSVSAGKSSR